jgi:hypothetical protein
MTSPLITGPEDAPHPAIAHEPTRRWLTAAGLPGAHSLMRFVSPTAARAATVREYLLGQDADVSQLDQHIGELLLVGHLSIDGGGADEVVLDGATGRVFSMWLYAQSPQYAKLFPLAPSVEALVGFLDAVDEFGSLRGRFAALAGRTGADAVAEASALLLSVFTDEDWGEGGWGAAGAPAQWDDPVPAFWRIAALIGPLALIAGPGGGLRLDLPKGLLDEEFGPDGVVRIAPADMPAALVHEPTRRFLAEVGLPKDGLMFSLEEECTLLPLPEDRERARRDPKLRHLFDGTDKLPPDADHLLILGDLMHDCDVVVDGRTGEIHYLGSGAGTVTPVNADISTLAFTVWMHSREQKLDEEHRFTHDFYHCLAATMVTVLASLDPVACVPAADPDDFRYWPEVFHDAAGAVL